MTQPTDLLKDTIVVANPGTGKTREIVERVIGLLESGLDGEDILCVTFTNKAAEEMKSRIVQEAYKHPGLWEKALRIEVSTIHSHASGYLESTGHKPEIVSNTVLRFITYNKLLELKTFTYGRNYLLSTIVPRIENAIRYIKSFGIMPEDIDLNEVTEMTFQKTFAGKSSDLSRQAIEKLVTDFREIFSVYEQFKEQSDTVDFNDLLRLFMKKGISGNRKYVFVDEFQDLNRMQADIVGKLAENRFFVGDRKQSIFGFQGGSLSSFNSYLKESGFSIQGKNLNYRSTNNILGFASSYYLSRSNDEFSRQEIAGLRNPNKGYGEKVSLIPSPSPDADAVSLLRDLLSRDINKDREYAIIARTNPQLERIAEILDEFNISYSSTLKNRTNISQIEEILSFLSGLASDDPHIIGKALMTPFSGLTLKEAFDLNRLITREGLDVLEIPEKFRNIKELKFGSSLLERAFAEIILPISASIGGDYMSTAVSVLNSAREYFSALSDYSLTGFLDFMALTGESSDTDLRKSRVNLLTVHKAKGLEFDTVIFLPSDPRPKLEYVDAMAYAIISSATGIDVESDLLEEPLRIDFVALTRARDKLYIVAQDRICSRFELENDFYAKETLTSSVTLSHQNRYDEQYMLFVNGRFKDAEDLLRDSQKWLNRGISDYFTGISRLSYSTINSISDPYQFLIGNILDIKEMSASAETGVRFHDLAQRYVERSVGKEQIPESLSQDFRNFDLILSELSANYIVPPFHSELKLEVPLSSVFNYPGVPDDILLNGRIDAVFKKKGNNSSYLIADYKTSKDTKSEYWQQIWLYLRMFQKQYAIPPERLDGGVLYVSLRGSIETGEKGFQVQLRDYFRIKTQVVENKIREILTYRDQPEKFVEKLLSKNPANELEERLRDALESST